MGTILLTLLVFLATIFIPFFSFSAPDELLLQPGPEVGKDTYVDTWFPDTPNGDATFLHIFGDPYRCSRIYIEFIELQPYVDSSYECLNATLSLFWYQSYPGPAPWLYVFRAAGPWEEDTLTWSNQPGYEGDPCIYDGPPPEEYGWVDVDVTEIVTSWFSGESEHYGFVLRLVYESYGYGSYFYSSDNFHDEKPKLNVEYQNIGVEPTSLGKIKAVYT